MNDIEEILDYIDDLIELTPVQEVILKGTWAGKKNWQIAQDFNHCSESHIKKESSQLWEKLSEKLEEKINKHNIRSKLEKNKDFLSFNHSRNCVLQNNQNNININSQFIQTTNNQQKRSSSLKEKETIIDLTQAPELSCDYGRDVEIASLKNWLENETKLITVCGLTGVGKTALILKLISEIKTEFDYIFYKSFDDIPKLINVKQEVENFLNPDRSSSLSNLISYFQQFRCLIVFDDFHHIFRSGELAGQYRKEYQDYSKFFQQIITLNHQSSFILISQEIPKDIEILARQNKQVKTLQLKGLREDAQELLKEKNLQDEEKWHKLIELYQSNPAWLNTIADTINEFYQGKVSDFLVEENEIFFDDLKPFLESHLERLSELENQVIKWFADREDELINLSLQPMNLEISNYQFLAVIKSLIRRCLVEKIKSEESTTFKLNYMFKKFIRECK